MKFLWWKNDELLCRGKSWLQSLKLYDDEVFAGTMQIVEKQKPSIH